VFVLNNDYNIVQEEELLDEVTAEDVKQDHFDVQDDSDEQDHREDQTNDGHALGVHEQDLVVDQSTV
jgi:hypothetical protein